jgi:uncharacterized Rmd1/YagE family protein
MPNELATPTRELSARAWLVGERIDLKALGSTQRLAGGPMLVPAGGGQAVVFKYGAVVLFGVTAEEERHFLQSLAPHVTEAYSDRESEQTPLRLDASSREVLEGSVILLKDLDPDRLQVVADVLAKSVLLARYEGLLSQTFDRIEPFAAGLQRQQGGWAAARDLLAHLGRALLAEHKMVARAQVDDSPDLLWGRPDLERLFAGLRDEFEIRERFAAVNRKLELISRTVQTALELLQNRRSLRVEWYIVILIVFEILLTLYQLAFFGGHK